MRLWDRTLNRQQPLGPSYNESMYTGAEYVSSWDTGQAGGNEPPAGAMVRMAREAMRSNGIVFAVQALRMALFSEARFQYQSLTDGHLFGDQSLTLLERPWPNADTGELLKRAEQDGSLGNAYFRKVIPNPDDGMDPAPRLVQMRPEATVIVSWERRDMVGRTWREPAGYLEFRHGGLEPQAFGVDEVAHFSPIPDVEARWRGMSWLSPILREVYADQALTRYKTFHLDNGAMPGIVVKYSMKLGEKTITTLRKRIKAKYGGPENAGNVLVLDEGADMTVAGSTLEQLQADAVTKAGERRIAAAGGPGLLVIAGFETGSYQDAIRQFADLWARPQWRMFCASLEHLLPSPAASRDAPVRLWYDVGGIAALREGELQRAQSFLVKAQGLASSIMAGMTRESSIKAAQTGDLSLLQPDPNAPPPGVSGRATERVGSGGFDVSGTPVPAGGQQQASGGVLPGAPQPPTGGPARQGKGRAPQAGRPQQLAQGRPNLPNALPAAAGAGVPALPGGARGSNGRRHVPLPDAEEEWPPWWAGYTGQE
jgi:Phage portal protein